MWLWRELYCLDCMEIRQDYFTLFNLPVAYSIDQSQLDVNYQTLQKTTHPDRFRQASDQEYRMAVQYSAYVNQAYEILKHPLSRAIYLLELQGETLDSEMHLAQDQEFLLQQIEWRDELESIDEKSNNKQADLTQFKLNVENALLECDKNLMDDFKIMDFNKAKGHIFKMQFLSKLKQQVNSLLAQRIH